MPPDQFPTPERAMRQLTPLIAILIFSTSAFAQNLKVEVIEAASVRFVRTITVTKVFDEDGVVISEVESDPVDGQPVESVVSIVEVQTDAANVSVVADDINRDAVPVKQIKDSNRFVIHTESGRTWVRIKAIDFDRNIFAEDSVTIDGSTPTPDPDQPYQPDDTAPLADQIHAAVSLVTKDPNKASTASTIAAVYRSVAGRAAGLSSMDAKGMIAETYRQLREKLTEQTRANWVPWSDAYQKILKSQNLGTDKTAHIKAWQEVAKGLSRVRSTTPKAAPTPATN
jgi:hypothetical protein